MSKVQVVLAKIESDVEVTGPWQADLGYSPKTREVKVAKACIWKLSATPADIEKAEAFAKLEGYRVFTYPTSERKPLELSKAAILAFQEENI